MVMKTFIAATCAAAFAGGMVYYTTSPSDIGGSATIKSETANPGDKGSKDIISRYIGADDEKHTELSADIVEVSHNPYVVEGNEDFHPHPIQTDSKKEEDEKLFESESDAEPVAAETVTNVVQDPDTNARKPRMIDRQARASENVETRQPENVATLPKRRPRNVDPMPNRDSEMDPAQKRINVVFEQAKKIDVPDLRDRAYLDLVDYATNNGLFDQAKKAAGKIQEVALRDTARERIAMGMARQGLSDEAFAIIEKIELDELRDVMRLRVIEALLGTDRRR